MQILPSFFLALLWGGFENQGWRLKVYVRSEENV